MMIVRSARAKDRAELYALWTLCFDESPAFADWFFSNRYIPEYCVVAEIDGRVAACAHGLPLHLSARETLLPGIMLAGVATHPDFRGMGLMHHVMRYFMEQARLRGVALVPHTPARLQTFFSLGHYPVCDALYARFDPEDARPAEAACEIVDLQTHSGALYRCYDAVSRKYSGMIRRSFADFVFKCADYGATASKCVAARGNNGDIEGYYFFETYDDIANGMECAAYSDAVYARLIADFAARTRGKKAQLRLPPDVRADFSGARAECAPKSVLGVANVSALLKVTGLSGHSIQVLDDFVPENAGFYRLDGSASDRAPEIVLSAGHLAQWAMGYKSAADLVGAGDATLLRPEILPVLDEIGRAPCYVIDEY